MRTGLGGGGGAKCPTPSPAGQSRGRCRPGIPPGDGAAFVSRDLNSSARSANHAAPLRGCRRLAKRGQWAELPEPRGEPLGCCALGPGSPMNPAQQLVEFSGPARDLQTCRRAAREGGGPGGKQEGADLGTALKPHPEEFPGSCLGRLGLVLQAELACILGAGAGHPGVGCSRARG